ncbi:MAG: transcriptional regulator [Deltaproteobacteria bacterium]|nr:transcriptional regulator [Deltaproteobacteria bacterium]TLN03968.1 MAG: transcriptional regulator [bacterium]
MQKGKPAKKYSQAGRVHDIIRLIEARHGITLEELAEEAGVTRRTIHRDLNAIQEAGYPLISERLFGRKVYRFLTRFKDVPPISFTLQELMTLGFLRSQLDFLEGTPFHDDMEAICRKVNSVLPPRYAAHMERIAGVSLPLLQGRRDYSRAGEALKVLRDALIYQNRVTIDYQVPGKEQPASYLLDPYTLIFHRGGLYLLGYAHNRRALRTFALERVSRALKENERFELPAEYRPQEQLQNAFGIVEESAVPVRVRFSAAVAHAVRDRIWHTSQKVEDLDDGGILLSFEAGGSMEIVSWVLSYGRHAEILAPPELRAELKGNVAEMGRMYCEREDVADSC